MKRIESIDKARGLVMVIMALDHVREFLHVTAATADPLNLASTTLLLFMTRWVTHLCAPAFVFISGISAFLYFNRSGSLKEARTFLLTRGIWLVLLEVTVVNFALWFDIRFRLVILEVISAIGFGFILLSLLLRLSPRTIGITGIVLIFTHDLWALLPAVTDPVLTAAATVFFRPGLTSFGEGFSLLSSYPVIPWLGIMLAGFWAGGLYLEPADRRKKVLWQAGAGALVLFVILRTLNYYGDPAPWSVQKNTLFTVLSFINVTKYAPSLLFTLVFTGFALLLLFVSEGRDRYAGMFTLAFGRVPLFFFIVHLYVIHLLMFGMLFLQGFGWTDFRFGALMNGRPEAGGGVALGWVYAVWVLVVVALRPVCARYGNYKAAHPQKWWMQYL